MCYFPPACLRKHLVVMPPSDGVILHVHCRRYTDADAPQGGLVVTQSASADVKQRILCHTIRQLRNPIHQCHVGVSRAQEAHLKALGGRGGLIGVVPAGTRQRRPVSCIPSADTLAPVPCDERGQEHLFPPGFCLARCFQAPEQDIENAPARVQSPERVIGLLSDPSKQLVLIATSMSQTLSQPHLDWQGPNPDQVLTIAFYESSANAEVLTHLVPASPSQGYIEITNTFHGASDLVQFSTHDIINGGVDTSGIRPSTLAVYPLHAKFGQDWMQHLQVHSHTPSHAKIDASHASIHASHARIEASHAKIDASHASPCHGPC